MLIINIDQYKNIYSDNGCEVLKGWVIWSTANTKILIIAALSVRIEF